MCNLNSEKGVSSWLSVLPISDHGLALHKMTARVFATITYQATVSAAFVSERHNDLRDFTGNLLTEVCRNVYIEPPLQALTGELLPHELQIQKMVLALMSVHKVFGVIVTIGHFLMFMSSPKCYLL